MALTLVLVQDMVVTTLLSSTVAAVFGTPALTKAVSRALTAGPEATRLYLVHTGAAALTPQLASFC